MNKPKPISSSLWVYNATKFSSESILNRLFLFIFFILDLCLIYTLCFIVVSSTVLLIFILYLGLSIIFFCNVK